MRRTDDSHVSFGLYAPTGRSEPQFREVHLIGANGEPIDDLTADLAKRIVLAVDRLMGFDPPTSQNVLYVTNDATRRCPRTPKRGEETPLWRNDVTLVVHAGSAYYQQFAYQLAHELAHVYYGDNERGVATIIEEAAAELCSLLALGDAEAFFLERGLTNEIATARWYRTRVVVDYAEELEKRYLPPVDPACLMLALRSTGDRAFNWKLSLALRRLHEAGMSLGAFHGVAAMATEDVVVTPIDELPEEKVPRGYRATVGAVREAILEEFRL